MQLKDLYNQPTDPLTEAPAGFISQLGNAALGKVGSKTAQGRLEAGNMSNFLYGEYKKWLGGSNQQPTISNIRTFLSSYGLDVNHIDQAIETTPGLGARLARSLGNLAGHYQAGKSAVTGGAAPATGNIPASNSTQNAPAPAINGAGTVYNPAQTTSVNSQTPAGPRVGSFKIPPTSVTTPPKPSGVQYSPDQKSIPDIDSTDSDNSNEPVQNTDNVGVQYSPDQHVSVNPGSHPTRSSSRLKYDNQSGKWVNVANTNTKPDKSRARWDADSGKWIQTQSRDLDYLLNLAIMEDSNQILTPAQYGAIIKAAVNQNYLTLRSLIQAHRDQHLAADQTATQRGKPIAKNVAYQPTAAAQTVPNLDRAVHDMLNNRRSSSKNPQAVVQRMVNVIQSDPELIKQYKKAEVKTRKP